MSFYGISGGQSDDSASFGGRFDDYALSGGRIDDSASSEADNGNRAPSIMRTLITATAESADMRTHSPEASEDPARPNYPLSWSDDNGISANETVRQWRDRWTQSQPTLFEDTDIVPQYQGWTGPLASRPPTPEALDLSAPESTESEDERWRQAFERWREQRRNETGDAQQAPSWHDDTPSFTLSTLGQVMASNEQRQRTPPRPEGTGCLAQETPNIDETYITGCLDQIEPSGIDWGLHLPTACAGLDLSRPSTYMLQKVEVDFGPASESRHDAKLRYRLSVKICPGLNFSVEQMLRSDLYCANLSLDNDQRTVLTTALAHRIAKSLGEQDDPSHWRQKPVLELTNKTLHDLIRDRNSSNTNQPQASLALQEQCCTALDTGHRVVFEMPEKDDPELLFQYSELSVEFIK